MVREVGYDTHFSTAWEVGCDTRFSTALEAGCDTRCTAKIFDNWQRMPFEVVELVYVLHSLK